MHNSHKIRSGEMKSNIFETYKNDVILHGHNIHKTGTYMAMEKMCPFPYDKHELPDWKCVLRCCDKCPIIVITGQ